jgi:hypothetical protein
LPSERAWLNAREASTTANVLSCILADGRLVLFQKPFWNLSRMSLPVLLSAESIGRNERQMCQKGETGEMVRASGKNE